jgi:hypothetical protein
MWNFGGKKSPKRVRSTLVIAFSFLFLGITAFVHYAGLTEADFLSATLSYENPDAGYLWPGKKSLSNLFGSNLGFLLIEFIGRGHSLYFPFQAIPPTKENPILLC